MLSSLNAVISTNKSNESITVHVLILTYKFQQKTTPVLGWFSVGICNIIVMWFITGLILTIPTENHPDLIRQFQFLDFFSSLVFIMSKKQEKLRSKFLSEGKITNVLGFLIKPGGKRIYIVNKLFYQIPSLASLIMFFPFTFKSFSPLYIDWEIHDTNVLPYLFYSSFYIQNYWC